MARFRKLLAVAGALLLFAPATASAGHLTWAASTSIPGFNGRDVACPTTSLCVAGGNNGKLAVSTNPTAATPTWNVFSLPVATTSTGGTTFTGDFEQVECLSATSCIAMASIGGDLFTSTDPANQASWTKVHLADGTFNGGGTHYSRDFDNLTCSTGSCIGADGGNSQVVFSSSPLGGDPAWIGGEAWPYTPNQAACAPGNACIATVGSRIYHTSNPGGMFNKWTSAGDVGEQWADLPGSYDGLKAVTCSASGVCLAGGSGTSGHGPGLYATSNPLGDSTAWTHISDFTGGIDEMTCSATGTRCLVWSYFGRYIWDTTDPAATSKTAWAYTLPAVAPGQIEGASCPDPTICFAVTNGGGFGVGTDGYTGGQAPSDPGTGGGNGNGTPPGGGNNTPPPPTTGSDQPPSNSTYGGAKLGGTPKSLDSGNDSLTLYLTSASDAQATVRVTTSKPAVDYRALAKKSKKGKIQTLGTAKVTLKAGKKTTVKVKLSAKAKKYFKKKKKLGVTITITATDKKTGAKKTTTKKVTLTLKK
jgi:hypothetical protein